jgi:hypothetical protein
MATTEDGTFVDDDMRFVTVVDRLGVGGDIRLKSGLTYEGTLYWDHKPQPILAKPFQWRGPIAKHLLRYGSQAYIKDIDDHWVCRLGIQGGDEELIAEIGPEFLDCSPIEIDPNAIERWDTSTANRTKPMTIKRTKAPTMAELRARGE